MFKAFFTLNSIVYLIQLVKNSNAENKTFYAFNNFSDIVFRSDFFY